MRRDTLAVRVYLFIVLALTVSISGVVSTSFAQACAQPSFTHPPIYPSGGGSGEIRALAIADFDGDGRPDIAAANAHSNSVSVLTNVGRGLPAGNQSYNVGLFPTGIAAADFNGDGKPDIVTANNSSFNISVLLNNGTGAFSPAATISTGPHTPLDVVTGDFNSDSRRDVVVSTGSAIMLFPGNGSGGFAAPVTKNGSARYLVAADFNSDGKFDLAVASGGIYMLFGDGTGQFNPGACGLGFVADDFTAGDLNGDGKLDLVTADIVNQQVYGAFGDGAGCFGNYFSLDFHGVGTSGHLTIGELNNDGKPDIISDTTVLLATGMGTFAPPVIYGSGSTGSKIVTSDFDADGNLDLVTAGYGAVSILMGDGVGGFELAVGQPGRGAYGVAYGDFNVDGKLDLVAMSNGKVALTLGDGSGGFSPPSYIPVPNSSSTYGPVVADFNRDTKLDMAVLDPSGNGPGGRPRLNVLLGDGAGGFAPAISTSINNDSPRSLVGSDFNRDGNPDLLTINWSGPATGGSISIMLGDGTGQFSMPTVLPVMTATNPKAAGVADFNGDGKLDLAVPSGFGFSVLIGDGAGGFGSPSHTTSVNASSIAVADFNADGKIDIAMVTEDQFGKLAVVLGDGSGGFGPPTQFSAGGSPHDLTVADFNGDHKLDIAVANGREDTDLLNLRSSISVVFGDGTGSFGLPSQFSADRRPGWIVSGDFNNDRRPDLLTANESVNNLTLFLNTCNGPTGPPPVLAFTTPAYSVSEGAGRIIVQLARAGDIVDTLTVEVRTHDSSGLNDCSVANSVASARCDYTTSVATLRFAPGETLKNISIPIVDDSYSEGNEIFTMTLSNATGATLGLASTTTITINDNETSNGPNPIDGTAFFVRQQYLDFLNREPDPAGFAAWQAVINGCAPNDTNCDRIHVSSSFFRSPEFQDRGYFVYRFYPVAFGRKPDYDEFVPDLAKVSGFLSASELEAAKVAFITEFMARPAFTNTYNGLNNTQYVDALLATAGVAPHQFRDFWIAALGNGTRTRATVLRDIVESQEVYNKYFNQAFVVMQYFGYLRRQPDGQYLAWIAVLDSSGDYRGMINGFMNSLEYRFRFGP